MQWTKWFLELIPFILYIPVYVQSNTPETGHFRVASSLSSKARLRAKPMRCKCGAWKKELKPLWQYFHMVVFFSISRHEIWIFSWILTLTTFVKARVIVSLLLGSHQWKSLDLYKRIQRSPTMTNMSGPFTFESLQRTCAHILHQTQIHLNYFVQLNKELK